MTTAKTVAQRVHKARRDTLEASAIVADIALADARTSHEQLGTLIDALSSAFETLTSIERELTA